MVTNRRSHASASAPQQRLLTMTRLTEEVLAEMHAHAMRVLLSQLVAPLNAVAWLQDGFQADGEPAAWRIDPASERLSDNAHCFRRRLSQKV